VEESSSMTTRWTAWYWKGAGAFGAGKVPIGYVTVWPVEDESEAASWTDYDAYGGLTPPSWSLEDLTE
jgi:hypothetical protein